MREGDTPLIHAARHDRAADVVALLADGADGNLDEDEDELPDGHGPMRSGTRRVKNATRPGRSQTSSHC